MTRLQRTVLAGSVSLASLLPASALAQINAGAITGIPTGFRDFDTIIKTAFNITILVSGILFVALLLYGGVLYLTSVGDDDLTGKARRIMINAAVGLVIVLSAFAIGTYVLSLLGLGQSGTLNTRPIQ